MSLSRFFLPAAEWRADVLTLTGDEAAHCARVLRKSAGEEIEVFDGAGRVAVTRITQVRKAEVGTQIVREWRHDALPVAIHLIPALIKAELFEWLLEKAVELGAASVQPVVTERTVVHLAGEHLEKKMTRWRRHMIESAKQCHTPWLPRLEAPRPFAQVVSGLPDTALKIMPALSERRRTLREAGDASKTTYVAVGPEGDFTPEEEALALRHGFVPVTLGPLILRAETAAITVLAYLGQQGVVRD